MASARSALVIREAPGTSNGCASSSSSAFVCSASLADPSGACFLRAVRAVFLDSAPCVRRAPLTTEYRGARTLLSVNGNCSRLPMSLISDPLGGRGRLGGERPGGGHLLLGSVDSVLRHLGSRLGDLTRLFDVRLDLGRDALERNVGISTGVLLFLFDFPFDQLCVVLTHHLRPPIDLPACGL